MGKLLYSNTFFDGKWRTNTSLDLWYGRDKRDRNPDDAANELESDGRNLRFAMNSNGTINIDKGDVYKRQAQSTAHRWHLY